MLKGVQFYRTEFQDVLACRWSKKHPGKMEVVRASRRNFRVQPVQWTIGPLSIEDPRKIDFKSMRPLTLDQLRADESLPERDVLLLALRQRFPDPDTAAVARLRR